MNVVGGEGMGIFFMEFSGVIHVEGTLMLFGYESIPTDHVQCLALAERACTSKYNQLLIINNFLFYQPYTLKELIIDKTII